MTPRTHAEDTASTLGLEPGTRARPRDLELALIGSWWIVSTSCAGAVVAALVLPARLVLLAGSALQVPHHDGPCLMCGMTRALVALGNGDFAGALEHNRGSLLLVGVVLVSGLAATVVLLRRVRDVTSCPAASAAGV